MVALDRRGPGNSGYLREYHGWSPLLVLLGLGHMALFLTAGLRHRRALPSALLFAAIPGLEVFLVGLFIDRGKAVVVTIAVVVPVVALAVYGYAWHRASQAERRSVPS